MSGSEIWLMLIASLFVYTAVADHVKHPWHIHRAQLKHPGRRISDATRGETYVCSLDSLQGRAAQYAVQAQSLFETFETELETLAQIIELHEQDFLRYGPLEQRYEGLERTCAPDCSSEELFWKDAANKTSEEIAAHQTGYWDIPDPTRPSDVYYPAWIEHYAFDWQSQTSLSYTSIPASPGLIKPRHSTNLTALCDAEGFNHCNRPGAHSNGSCPSYCVWPAKFNNSIIVYESVLTQDIIRAATSMLNQHANYAAMWYWMGADTGSFRNVPTYASMIGEGATPGTWLGSDPQGVAQSAVFAGPILNPSKGVAWRDPISDYYGNLWVTAARPVYIAGKWFGAVMTDIMLASTSELVEQFRMTENSHTVLCDKNGEIIGATEATYSLLFCPEHPSCNGGSTFNTQQSWSEITMNVKGPQLKKSKLSFFAEGSPLMLEITEQSSGMQKVSGYYVVWSSLQNADLFGGARIVGIVPAADIDMAAGAEVEPQLIPLFKHQTEASVKLTNHGALPWEWKASSPGDSVHCQKQSGVVHSGANLTLALERLVTNTSLELTISATGRYATCIPPISVYLAINCENGEYRDGSFGSDSCKPCIEGHKCLANILSPCSEGTAQPDPAQATCEPCAFGHYQDKVGKSTCQACDPGTTSELTGASFCVNCSAGRFSESRGSSSCAACPRGKYQRQVGAQMCNPCNVSQTTQDPGSITADDCGCPPGEYLSVQDEEARCRACPKGMTCPGFAKLPLVTPGYYSKQIPADPSAGVWLCKDDKTCTGQKIHSDSLCASHSTGLNCARCEEGTSRKSDGTCEECEGGNLVVLPFFCIAGFLACGAFHYAWNHRTQSVELVESVLASVTVGVTLAFMQQVGIMNQLRIEWPDEFEDILAFVSVFLFDLDFLKISCVVPESFVSSYLIGLIMPAVLATFFFLWYVVSRVVHMVIKSFPPFTYSGIFNSVGMVLQALYISVVSATITIFMCYSSGPKDERVLTNYPWELCYSSTWYSMLPFAILAMIVYVIGFFATMSWLAYTAPTKWADKDFRTRTRFLFFKFRVDQWWYGLFLVVRSLAFALVPVVSPDDGYVQFFLLLFILVGAVVVHLVMRPYSDAYANLLETIELSILIIILAIGSWWIEDKDEDLELTLSIALCISFVVCALALLGTFTYASVLMLNPKMANKLNSKHLCEVREEYAAICKSFLELDEAAQTKALSYACYVDLEYMRHVSHFLTVVLQGQASRRVRRRLSDGDFSRSLERSFNGESDGNEGGVKTSQETTTL